MAEPKDRTIGGLQPRAPKADLSSLRASTRVAAHPAPLATDTTSLVDPAAPKVAQPVPAPKATAPRSRPTERHVATAPTDQARGRVAAYFSEANRDRARAAFRATQHREFDESFSAFVELAVMNEVARREREYNDGKPFATTGGNLRAGRPLGN